MNISSKITLYDFLCMLVCGYLILYILRKYCNLPYDNDVLFYVLSYIVGMVYHKMIYFVLGNKECMVMYSRDKVEKKVENELLQPRTMISYYQNYYYLMQKNCLNNIPVLEAQAAFSKDVFFLPFLLVLIKIVCICFGYEITICICSFPILVNIIWLSMPFVWYVTQMKIHYLVWEGAYYLKKIEKEQNEKSNP